MADDTEEELAEPSTADAADGEEEEQASGRGGLLIPLVLAVALGGGGFFAAFSGMLPIGGDEPPPKAMAATVTKAPASFVPITPLVISLGPEARAQHLRFSAQLEVAPDALADVEALMPRILDVLNTYLRAVSEADIESPAAMTRLRAHMLRRIQIVTGDGWVKEILITEFVLN